MDAAKGHRRTTTPGGTQVLLRYAAGDSLTNATFIRASTASYSQQVTDTMARYQVGGSAASATFTRASGATFSGNA